MGDASTVRPPLSFGRIARTWWPLAASWALMGLEGPMVAAVLARLADPKINLAAYGGIVFPLALVIEAPIIMLLAASTALSRDWQSYVLLRRFTHGLSAVLTLLHLLIVATPLYYVVVEGLIGAPAAIVEPARVGLAIMVPWSWAIAYRRFNQGVLIRFGRSLMVGTGTLVRLAADTTVLTIGYLVGSIPGVIVASCAIMAGVFSEAAYAHISARPVVATRLRAATGTTGRRLTFRSLLAFYVPLSLTSLLGLLIQPIGSAAMSRLPGALESLAVWPVVTGVSFLLRSPGFAYNEVVVALLDEPAAAVRLRRFARLLSVASTGALLVMLLPLVGGLWFEGLIGLPPSLAVLAQRSLWIALPLPAFSVLGALYQGLIVDSRKTRGITEAVALSLGVICLVLFGAVAWGAITGIYAAMAAFTLGEALRTTWLHRRSRVPWMARTQGEVSV
jgi:hypothetical protein